MTAESLSTVFSPNILRSADDDVGFFFANMAAAHRATKMLVTHVSVLDHPLLLVLTNHRSYSLISSLMMLSLIKLTRMAIRMRKKRNMNIMTPQSQRRMKTKLRCSLQDMSRPATMKIWDKRSLRLTLPS